MATNGDGIQILRVENIGGPGRRITECDLFYAFNLNAIDDIDEPDTVLDIVILTANFALVKMASVEAATKARNALDQSWLFDKFIKVNFGSRQHLDYFPPDSSPIGDRFHRRPHSQNGHGGDNYGHGYVPANRNNLRNGSNGWGQNLGDGHLEGANDWEWGAANDGPDIAENGQQWDEQQSVDQESDLGFYAAKMPAEYTRHLRPGTHQTTDEWNLHHVRRSREQLRQNQDEFAREVDRDRGPPSPVLHVSGLEMLSDLVNGKMLSRLDLLNMFYVYGNVVDIEIGLWKEPPIEEYNRPCRHRALVQMSSIEEATKAMNNLDQTWQMGRYIEVTYSHYHSIEFTKNAIRDIRAFRKGRISFLPPYNRMLCLHPDERQIPGCMEWQRELRELNGGMAGQSGSGKARRGRADAAQQQEEGHSAWGWDEPEEANEEKEEARDEVPAAPIEKQEMTEQDQGEQLLDQGELTISRTPSPPVDAGDDGTRGDSAEVAHGHEVVAHENMHNNKEEDEEEEDGDESSGQFDSCSECSLRDQDMDELLKQLEEVGIESGGEEGGNAEEGEEDQEEEEPPVY